jgi:hypothetical protein
LELVLPETNIEDLHTVLTFLYTGATNIKVKKTDYKSKQMPVLQVPKL